MAHRACIAVALGGLAACGDNAAGARDAAVPDATIDGPPRMPDLTLLGDQMATSVRTIESAFAPSACEVVEGCVGAPGLRQLLTFDTISANLGTADIVLGARPPDGVSNDQFVWSPCHMHHHAVDFAVYELRDANGVVIGGHKQAFCLQDIRQVRPGWASHGFDCFRQGISAGWADVYERTLPCQWIDVTNVTPGTYTLVVRVNPTGKYPDHDLTNNEWTLNGIVIGSVDF